MAQNDEAKRATTVLTIAQLKFKQAVKKEDIDARLPPVSVEASSHFFRDLDAVLKQNTPVNVQKCTEWVVKHVAPSKARSPVLGDYLVAVSRSIAVDQQTAATAAAKKKAARNRFDLLLIASDILHTDKYHRRSNAKQGIFSKESASSIAELVELAASCAFEKDSQPEKRLRAILNYWAVNQLVSPEDIKSLRERAEEGLLLAQGGTPVRKRNYLLPEYHGDRTAPWHDLPASYMLEQMIRYPKRPIDPSRIKIAKLDKKPVSPHIRKLLDNFFENIDLKYVPTGDNPTGETKKYKLSLDPMGQLVKQDKETGTTTTAYNGYGWSMKFCQDMQKHGVPENIKIAREDIERMEDAKEVRETQQKRHRERRYSPSPRRHRQSSSESDYKQERGRHSRSRSRSRSQSRSRRGSSSSYDSRRSRSRSRDRSYNRRHRSPRDKPRGSDDRDQKHDDKASGRTRPPPRPYGMDSSQAGSQWNGSNASNRNVEGSTGSNQYPGPVYPPQTLGHGFSHPPQPSFSAPPFSAPPPPPPMSQFPGPFPVGQYPPPHPPIPPPQFQGPGGFPGNMVPPPPPPPNFSGPYHAPPPNMTAMPQNPYSFGNQYSNQQVNNFGFGNSSGYSQSPGSRGGYGGNAPGGGYNNRGGYSGSQRGQRGGRY
ncbi:hypothetical protein BKA66DRAFT_454588 [Pyrenochaeta sp. MPI-SDFR-AT-0127]|nr:hypothetical protein BKA66DRAFT_454588 [Pyrenochaeta sp. MPI-SDFR-AT-0127]